MSQGKNRGQPQEPEEAPSHLVRKFVGVQAAPLAKELRLRGGMFNDHMPWGYASLFEGHGGDTSGLTLDMITHICKNYYQKGTF